MSPEYQFKFMPIGQFLKFANIFTRKNLANEETFCLERVEIAIHDC